MGQQHERHYRLRHLLESGGCYSLERLMRELEVSASTIKRKRPANTR